MGGKLCPLPCSQVSGAGLICICILFIPFLLFSSKTQLTEYVLLYLMHHQLTKCINETLFRRHRLTIDKMETREQFGPIVVDYSQVQTKINMKYDTWHKEILSKFGKINMNFIYVTLHFTFIKL